MAERVIDYIKKNYNVFCKFSKLGKIPNSIINEYNIYLYYQSTSHIKSKMQRYTLTSEAMRINEKSVRNAVKEMERFT